MIGTGDFLQLPPIPDAWDEGSYCFQSNNWNAVFPHQILLKRVHRQSDPNFVMLLHDIAHGSLNEKSEAFIETLQRPLPNNQSDNAISFFSLSDQVMLANMVYLDKLEGELRVFTSKDKGSEALLNRETNANKKLALKEGAKVMCTFNISKNVKNGTTGTVVDLKGQFPVVNFESVGVRMEVKAVLFTVFDHCDHSKVAATRTQIPLMLAKSMTVHKGQGQTVSKAIVHSGNEFCPGQLYVALSRVRCAEDIQVLGFDKTRLYQPCKSVIEYLSSLQTENTDSVVPHFECKCSESKEDSEKALKIPRKDDFMSSSLSTFGIDGYDEFDELFMNEIEGATEAHLKEDFTNVENEAITETDLDILLESIDILDEALATPPENMDFKVSMYHFIFIEFGVDDVLTPFSWQGILRIYDNIQELLLPFESFKFPTLCKEIYNKGKLSILPSPLVCACLKF